MQKGVCLVSRDPLYHSSRIKKHFETRTKGQSGVLKDILATSNNNHTILLGDNDYLNLVRHKDVVTKQAKDLVSSTLSRDTAKSSVFLSEFDLHTALEKDLTTWYGKGCYLAQSGYAANVGVMHAICTPGMHVYVDQFLHMSFYDGLAARQVKVHPFKPNNTIDLENKITKYGPGLILIESIYSTSGAFGPLEEIIRIKKSHNCLLVVDESHSFGLFGPQGLGFLHVRNLVPNTDYITASLAKAYATRAGIVFTNNAVYVKENSYPFIFSSGLVQNGIIRIRAMWEVIKASEDRRIRLINISTFFRQEMNKVTHVVGGMKDTPCAIMASLHRFFSERGILAAPFSAPATPLESPVLRFTVHCDVSARDVVVVTRAVEEWMLSVARGAKL
ncbi:pyridoxal phosphate-dependent transferase [Aspergillus cavernicola]|uniref:Pyridoxal phosphate-dependent transferase n=1 Tax=Aspergillus cavernicola TaxID=176166 RepID=A0ABR4HRW0_9EURO